MPGWSSLTSLLFNPEKKWSKKLVGKKLVDGPGDDASVSPAALPHFASGAQFVDRRSRWPTSLPIIVSGGPVARTI
jgi:hypothetical protein